MEKLRLELNVDTHSAAEALVNSKIVQLEMQMQNMQDDYEQELAIQKLAHRRELARSKDDLLQLLTAAESKSLNLDKGMVRKKYMKEIDRIKVKVEIHTIKCNINVLLIAIYKNMSHSS